jgi:hypothetical protein
MLELLRRFCATPVITEPYASARTVRSFQPRGAAARKTAEQLRARGYLDVEAEPGGKRGYRITESGRRWLVENDDPCLLLEDLLRASEEQCEVLRRQEQSQRLQRDQLQVQCDAIRQVLARLPARDGCHPLEPTILEKLRCHADAGRPADATVAELYQHVRSRFPAATIGQFHDVVRSMHEAGRIRLAPWTGPLYQLPQPALALLIGHEVLYYVQLTCRHAA